MARRLAVALALVAGCSAGSHRDGTSTTAPFGDTTAPRLLHASPEAGATGVPPNARIALSFSERMSADPAVVTVTGPSGSVAGLAVWDSSAARVVFAPGAPLEPDAIHTVSISASDASGNRLDAARFSFRTGTAPDRVAPRVVSVSPADATAVAAAGAAVTVTFDEAIDCTSLATTALTVAEDGRAVAGAECAGATLSFPAGRWSRSSLAVRLAADVADAAGNVARAERTWAFEVLPWTRWLASPGADRTCAVAATSDGDVAVGGSTEGALDGGAGAAVRDAVVARYAPSGAPRWVRQLRAPDGAVASGVATRGRWTWVAGTVSGAFEGTSGPGGSDGFLALLDPSGATSRIDRVGTAADDAVHGLAYDGWSRAIVVGQTAGTFPGERRGGAVDAFVAMYGDSGGRRWIRQLGSAADDVALAVAVDARRADGRVVVVGSTRGALTGRSSAGGEDAFVAFYGDGGTLIRVVQFGSAGDDRAEGVDIDAMGRIHVVGTTTGALGGSAPAGSAAFVSEVSEAGVIWVNQLRAPGGSTSGRAIASDPFGRLYVAGTTTGTFPGATASGGSDAFVARVVSIRPNLHTEWVQQVGTGPEDLGVSLALEQAGPWIPPTHAFVAGATRGGLDGHVDAGGGDAFVLRLDAGGRLR